jgi:hypothetical protein
MFVYGPSVLFSLHRPSASALDSAARVVDALDLAQSRQSVAVRGVRSSACVGSILPRINTTTRSITCSGPAALEYATPWRGAGDRLAVKQNAASQHRTTQSLSHQAFLILELLFAIGRAAC